MSHAFMLSVVVAVLLLVAVGVIRAGDPVDLPVGGVDSGSWQCWTVALDGDLAVVTCLQDDAAAFGGSATVYRKDGATGVWGEEAVLTANGGDAGDQFGSAVAVHGDTVVVGAPGRGGCAGSAYVYTYDLTAETWSQAGILAPDGDEVQFFGIAVAAWGETILVGAPLIDKVSIFERNGSGWEKQEEFAPHGNEAGIAFGWSVDVGDDVVAIGAVEAGTAPAGAVHVFRREDQVWSHEQTIVSDDTTIGDQFGSSVSLSDDDDTLLVGSAGHDDGVPDTGAAYVFAHSKDDASWTQTAKLSSETLHAASFAGRSVSLGDQVAVVGVPATTPGGSSRGSVCIWTWDETNDSWSESASISSSEDSASVPLGQCVAADGKNVLAGTHAGPAAAAKVLDLDD